LDPQTAAHGDAPRWPRVARNPSRPQTPMDVLGHRVGGGELTLIAGPCAVESEEQLMPLARSLKAAGVQWIRGGAYKPRTSPYEFQGLGVEGLRLLATARDEFGLAVVSEAVDETSLARVEEWADVIQIGARNMHNFELLKRAGRTRKPIFLKRGFSAQMEDLLWAAEYIANAGNPDILLCERGIRTFSDHSRFTLDLSIVPRLLAASRLPVFVDPSHACGRREDIHALARAAVAVGADGVMLEVHPDPESARSDGPQSLSPDEFFGIASDLRHVHAALRSGEEVAT